MADQSVDLLEQKIEQLEKRVIGDANKDASYPKDTPEIIDTLASLKHQIQTSVVDRQKIQPTMKKLGELNDYLDPSFTDSLTMEADVKTNIILSEEDFIRDMASQLERVKDMADVLGSEHIKVIPTLENKLHALSKIHVKQQDKSCELTEEVKDLFTQYNNIITALSKQFVQWDEVITKLENSRQPQKPSD